MTESRRGPALLWLALVAAHTLFLWMFLSVAPIEATGKVAPAAGALDPSTDRISLFVADWRHGMAGNSPLYMPGFFAVGVAGWYWTRRQSWLRLVVEGTAAVAIGTGVAWLAAPFGTAAAMAAFAARFPLATIDASASITQAMSIGVLTDVCWMVFVVASRRAVAAGSPLPLLAVPPAYAALIVARPWTPDSLPMDWWPRVLDGNAAAIGSLLAIPVFAAVLVVTAIRMDTRLAAQGRERANRSRHS